MFDIILPNIEVKETTNKIYNFIFIKHSFLIPIIIILVCWLPYIISLYPGTLFQDSANQIKQYFGYNVPENSSTNSVKLIDENVKITNHHPVVHTFILGTCVNIGKLLGSDNLGIFLYTILQVTLLACTFGYVINFMKKLKIPDYIRVLSLTFFALVPIIPVYAMEITKDVPFTCFIIIYIIQLYELLRNTNKNKITIKKMLEIIVLAILISLFRNNGIYVIIMSLPFLSIVDKTNRVRVLISFLVIVAVYTTFNAVLLPMLKISKASVREALCIPFQQTARYVKRYETEISEYEKKVIDKVLDYETLAKRYDPLNADPVKNKYNKDATEEELDEYLKTWLNGLIKHPNLYVQATINNCYGYFYPESKVRQYTTDFVVDEYEALNETGGFNYSYIKELRGARLAIYKLARISQKIPGISWVINIGLNVWMIIIIFVYLLYIRNYKYLIYLMPFVSIILVCVASPINAYYRYTISFIFALPITIGIFIDILKRKEEDNEK